METDNIMNLLGIFVAEAQKRACRQIGGSGMGWNGQGGCLPQLLAEKLIDFSGVSANGCCSFCTVLMKSGIDDVRSGDCGMIIEISGQTTHELRRIDEGFAAVPHCAFRWLPCGAIGSSTFVKSPSGGCFHQVCKLRHGRAEIAHCQESALNCGEDFIVKFKDYVQNTNSR